MKLFLLKDLLIFWRDRKEMLIALIAPILLVVVLGLTLQNNSEGPLALETITAGLVIEETNDMNLQEIEALLYENGQLKEDETIERTELPSSLLLDFFEKEEIQSLVSLQTLTHKQAEASVAAGDLEAFITIPEDFDLNVYRHLYTYEGQGGNVQISANNDSISVTILREMIQGFVQAFNYQSALFLAADDEMDVSQQPASIGGEVSLEGRQPITSFQYFTLSMGILFCMFVASTIATKAGVEKRERTFERILLSDRHPLSFLLGKIGAAFVLAWLQLHLLLVICQFAFQLFQGVSFTFWLGMLAVTTTFSIVVAAFAGLLTALAYRMNNSSVSNILGYILIFAFGTIGGNLVPLYFIPYSLQELGEWTPNGLVLATLIQWIQQGETRDLVMTIVLLLPMSLGLLFAAIGLFPQRGRL
ncbi:ABC transporter permease [Aureibacillus halotolerans]|uniref:ABC-2 type transport system permease protein n=1 Tax=Aureibacillus halotolerans TaxID=1508390 RepID=A0A4R6TRN6_9BACI|nr:ABC transporter permease [Aureibacillus halotolerans]TDQ36240.1 ABC-2 type transport system permease protein [Aureibacillus halotolerans]